MARYTRYIDADRLVRRIQGSAELLKRVGKTGQDSVIEEINDFANKHPAPVNEWTVAYWTEYPNAWECSNCRTTFSDAVFGDWEYCPKCGARTSFTLTPEKRQQYARAFYGDLFEGVEKLAEEILKEGGEH